MVEHAWEKVDRKCSRLHARQQWKWVGFQSLTRYGPEASDISEAPKTSCWSAVRLSHIYVVQRARQSALCLDTLTEDDWSSLATTRAWAGTSYTRSETTRSRSHNREQMYFQQYTRHW